MVNSTSHRSISKNDCTRLDVRRKTALRVLELHLPGWISREIPEIASARATERSCGDEELSPLWHYLGESGWLYGIDHTGHGVEKNPRGKVSRIYSQNLRSKIIECAGTYGAAKAARKYDMSAATIRGWILKGIS